MCVGNTCRSQMAEAIVNARISERWEAFSAGSHPGEAVNPLALQALEEIGIFHTGWPKSVEQFRHVSLDQVVILCDQDDAECPVWLGKGKVVIHPYPDPARETGSDDQKMFAYRSVRDRMVKEIPGLLT